MRKFDSMMPKSEWIAPSLEVGDIAVVLHSYYDPVTDADAQLSDLICGDTRVIRVQMNGTIILANGGKFHRSGYGHSCNKHWVLSTRHALDRTRDGKLPEDAFTGKTITRPATRDGHYLTF